MRLFCHLCRLKVRLCKKLICTPTSCRERLPHFAEKFGYGDFIQLEHHRRGFARMMKGGVFFREIADNCWIRRSASRNTSGLKRPCKWCAPSL